MCSSRKYPYSPHRRVFCFARPLPLGNSSLASYFTSKILAFKTPLPLGISNDLPRGGYGFFLELHNQINFVMCSTIKLKMAKTATVESKIEMFVSWFSSIAMNHFTAWYLQCIVVSLRVTLSSFKDDTLGFFSCYVHFTLELKVMVMGKTCLYLGFLLGKWRWHQWKNSWFNVFEGAEGYM